MRFFLSSVMVFAAVSGVFAQTRTVTNSDLEKFRVEREAADRALRERYKRLGLPSPEEIQKETERRNAEFIRYSQQLRAERVDAENGIIARANFLRSQIAALDAQIDYLRSGASGSVYRGGQSVGYGFYGYYGGGRYRAYQSSDELRRISQLPPNMRTAAEYALSFPTAESIRRQATEGIRVAPSRGYRRGYGIAPVVVYQNQPSNDSSGALVYLEAQRAGLMSQWRAVEEEARRAGIRLD